MSNRIVAAIGAGALAVGILVGAAGAIVVGDLTSPSGPGTGSIGQMMNMMGGWMLGDADVDRMVELHAQHHGTDR